MCTYLGAVSEKACQRGSINSRKAFAKIWKVFAIKYYPVQFVFILNQAGNFPNNPDTVRTIIVNSIKFWGKF